MFDRLLARPSSHQILVVQPADSNPLPSTDLIPYDLHRHARRTIIRRHAIRLIVIYAIAGILCGIVILVYQELSIWLFWFGIIVMALSINQFISLRRQLRDMRHFGMDGDMSRTLLNEMEYLPPPPPNYHVAQQLPPAYWQPKPLIEEHVEVEMMVQEPPAFEEDDGERSWPFVERTVTWEMHPAPRVANDRRRLSMASEASGSRPSTSRQVNVEVEEREDRLPEEQRGLKHFPTFGELNAQP
jgi:type IV secretory pathway TrbD component